MEQFAGPDADEGSQPSIFEVLAAESLASGLRDAFRHFTKVLAENFPHKFGTVYQCFEEVYTLSDFVFQFVHLRVHGSSFAERFYNLVRAPDARSPQVSRQKVFSFIFASAVIPYIRLQLENIYKKIKDAEYNETLNLYKEKVKQLALFYASVYPWLHFLWETSYLCYFFAFAMNKSKYHSPVFHVVNSWLLRRQSDDDMLHLSDHITRNSRMIHILWKMAILGVKAITFGLASGAYVLQFLGWWYRQQDSGATVLAPMPIPPPPPQWPTEQLPDVCPLCLKKRTNDTALSSSGFVFCYPCIFNYVREQKRCPVTGYPASLDELIRIYHDDHDM